MFIRYDEIGDQVIANIPDSTYWEIRFRLFTEDTGDDDYNLYLIVGDREITLRDTDYWCQGRLALPYQAVGALYEEMVNVITEKIASDPTLKFIDITEIEAELIASKYEREWLDNGYIKLDANGCW